MKQTVSSILLLGLTLLLCTGLAFAQRLDGSLRGLVTDPQGAVVSGAKVTVQKDGTDVAQTTESSSAGTYVFPNLLTGSYTVTVEASGFQKFTRRNVVVSSNQVVEAHARLTVGDAGTTVEVVAGAELVQTETAQLSNTFNQRQVTELPVLNGNNVLNLAVLAPNVTSQGGGIQGTGGSVGGTRSRMNNFTVDGLDDNDLSVTGPTSAIVQDAVSEFSLLTNQFSAEYGHSAGGQFNLVTKSGTNSWHGTAAHFLSNRKLNALDNQQKEDGITRENGLQPRFDSNFTSGTLGGAIIKNKVFVFGALEHQGFGFPGAAPTFDAPTATGLANLRTLAENAAILEILDQFPIATSTDQTFLVTNFNSGTTLPVDVGSTSIFTPSFQNLWNWHANGDINLGRHQIRLRYLNNTFTSPNDATIPLPQFSGALTAFAKKATVNHIWSLSDRFINDFRLGYTRSGNSFGVSAAFLNFPNVQIGDLADFDLGPQGNSPQGEVNNTYQIIEQMTYSKGRHTLKWGVEGRRWIAVSSFLPRGRGDWGYDNFNQFINDFVPTTVALRGAGDPSFIGNQSAFYGFFQDDFKVTPRLTLNLGMRYEWGGVPNGAKTQAMNQISNLPGVYDFRAPVSDKNNWAPRIGFALDPTGAGKWAVRGGFGMSYDVTFHNFYSIQLPPQLQSEQDPDISCALSGPPVWCAGYDPLVAQSDGNTGQGFLAGGGLLQVNVPCASQAECRAATGAFIPDQIQPTIYTWSFSVQRELHRTNSLEVRYLGTKSTLLPIQIQTNARTAFRNGALPMPVFFDTAGIPADFTGAQSLTNFNGFFGRPFAADGFVGSVTSYQNVGDAIYHAVSADFVQRAWRGLNLRANYTFAKNLDNATNEFNSSAVNPRRPEDREDLGNERGRSALDINHKFALSWIYDVPKLQTESGILRKLLHGWQIGGTYLNQSGQPVALRSNRDVNLNGDAAGDRALINPNAGGTGATDLGFVCFNAGGPSFTSAVQGGVSAGGVETGCALGSGAAPGTSGANFVFGYFPLDATAHFVRGRTGVLTNVGRNTINTPGFNIANVSIFKNTHITESKYIQFRFEMFNAFNHRNFSFADPGVFGLNPAAQSNGDFSVVGTTAFLDEKRLNGGNRLIQLAVKFVF